VNWSPDGQHTSERKGVDEFRTLASLGGWAVVLKIEVGMPA